MQIKLSISPSHSVFDTGPTRPSAVSVTPGAWRSSHWTANQKPLMWLAPENSPRKIRPGESGNQTLVSTKTECDYLSGWIKKKKTVTLAKISRKMVNPRDTAGEREEEEEEEEPWVCRCGGGRLNHRTKGWEVARMLCS